MELPSNRLYSGPLSVEAQKILAVLRAQSRHTARRSHSSSHHSQLESSQVSSWSMSQEDSRETGTDRPQVSPTSTSYHEASNQRQSSQTPDSLTPSGSSFQRHTSQSEAYYRPSQIYPHRKTSEHPAGQSSQALSFTRREETAAPIPHRGPFTLSLQTPGRLGEHQATPWRNSAEVIGPPFIQNLSLDDEEETLFPTTEHPNTQRREATVHKVYSCFKISEETQNDTLVPQKGNAESWHVLRKKTDHTVSLDILSEWRLPLSIPSEEVIRGEQEGGLLYQLEEGAEEAVHSENMMQMSDVRHEMQDEVTCEKTRHIEKESANEKEGPLSGTNENATLAMNLNFTSNTDKRLHCYSDDAKSCQEENNDFECRVTPEIKEVEHPADREDEEASVGFHSGSPKKISVSLELGERNVSHCQAEKPQDMSRAGTETEEKHCTENPLLCEPNKLVLGGPTADNLQRNRERMEVNLEVQRERIATSNKDKMETEQHHCCDVQMTDRLCESDWRKGSEKPGGETVSGEQGGDRNETVKPPVDCDNESSSAEGRDQYISSTPTLSQECGAKRSKFRAPCNLGNQLHHDNIHTASGDVRGSHVPAGQNSSPSAQDLSSTAAKLDKSRLLTSHSRHLPLIPSFPLKRKHEHQCGDPPSKIHQTKRAPKWEPPQYSQEKAGKEGVNELKRASTSIREAETEASSSHTAGHVLEVDKDTHALKKTRQIRQSKVAERCREIARIASKPTPASVPGKELKHKRAKPNGPKISHDEADGNETHNQSKASCLNATLTSDPRVKDSGKMNQVERMQMLEEAGKSETLVLTLVYRDGTTQLDAEQKHTPEVCGLLMLMKDSLASSNPEDSLAPNNTLVYLKLEHTPAWAQQHTHQSQELFTRDMLLQVLSRSQLVVCYKAKDLLRTALQFYRRDLSWKQVAGCRIQDPQVSGWLLDPEHSASCFQDLLNKHSKRPHTTPALGTKKVSQVISGLYSLHWLNMELCFKLQSQGLWELYSDMELNMISVLAAMESHRIHVDKAALKRTSDLLGTKMKHLEQEAHRAAGQIFLVTSSTQLRAVLFEKLCLHERCENKKLPKTINTQQQSTSEAALLQLQDLHPLPKIILEYRQVHKIKSTFVDGILSCMKSKNYVSSTWHQTSVVTGRISAKHPNFQALPKQPLQFTKKQYIEGKEEEIVTVHPRAMFIPQEGWTFLAADFCQVELRLLAHLSSDPELLRIFTDPQADVFTMLAAQWKGVSEGEVTSEDREHAKRIVYSVVYGAGRERLSGILGVSAEKASRFQDSFLQSYREVQTFIQRTIQLCHKRGYVLSIMGRRRTLANINSPDWGIRMQAERQAVNFVVQGSAADLCKMAMIRIFNLVSSSSSLSARLVAQLHDELLYEVEESQVEQFAGLVKSTMESLQHIDHLGVHLKVPLKVAVSSGKSWGSMSELIMSPSASL
ncbi:hypothetical protein CgunFtcFv8_006292 [Champsocephalus gunnari]|uniref:DNA-directed DNA polymerase n=1 Tax=Champsocephalus gunnari TaxID=52237 RepID=A0AAN8GV64_CHAGU|nr:hypothetical protein CgunFtcFv8_006292 [Champsocephalus gunnari]